MVIVNLKLEVPDEEAAAYFLQATDDWCDEHEGWVLLSVGEPEAAVPRCPTCNERMVFEPALQEYVCHHADE